MNKIKLTRGYVAIVSDEDVGEISQSKWCSDNRRGHVYAVRGVREGEFVRKVQMHREIAGAEHGDIVYHINGNSLDNRRENLRVVTGPRRGSRVVRVSQGGRRHRV